MDINITLKAPDLSGAIQSLADAVIAAGCIPAQNIQLNSSLKNTEMIQQMEMPQAGQFPPVQQVVTVPPIIPTQAQQYTPPAADPNQATIPITPPGVPTTVQTYTMEQLAVAATQLMDAGRRSELLTLLSQFGVQALTALPKEQYGAFATQLRVLGAKI